MTTVLDFVPSVLQPFSFQATFDGQQYTVVVTWNVYGQRWYVNVYALGGGLVAALPLIGSPVALLLESLVWDQLVGIVVATTVLPLPYPVGSQANLTVAGCVPTAYNGTVLANITEQNVFTYPMMADPGGVITTLGVVDYGVNMLGGYFSATTLLYRDANRQFEITP